MSNQLDSFANYLNFQTIQTIDQLNLPTMQKHHVRILAHCLAILNAISVEKNFSSSDKDNLLKEWCYNQSQKFNDQKFSNLLYLQLKSTAKKLNTFSQRIGKDIKELSIEDLVLLVQEN